MEQAFLVYYGGILGASFFAGISQRILLKSKNEKTKKLNNIFWILSMMLLILIFGFRQPGVGVDDESYLRIFQQTANNGPIKQFLNTTMEPGYLIFNYLISLFTNNFQVVIVTTTAIALIFYFKALKFEMYHINMFFGVFLLGTILLIFFCGIIRLMIACSIIAYSLRYIIKRKTTPYVLLVLLATSFHYSAIFMIFLAYFTIGKKRKSNLLFFALALTAMPIVIFIVQSYIFPSMGDRYSNYSESAGGSIFFNIFDKLPFLILAIFFSKKMNVMNKNINIYISIYAMSIIFSAFSVFMSIGRMQWYCMFSMCIILPNILEVLKKIKKQEYAYLYIPLMVFYAFFYSYKVLMGYTRTCMLTYNNILF